MLGDSGRTIGATGRAKGLVLAQIYHVCLCNTKNNKTTAFAAFSAAPQAALQMVGGQKEMCLCRLFETIAALVFILSELN